MPISWEKLGPLSPAGTRVSDTVLYNNTEDGIEAAVALANALESDKANLSALTAHIGSGGTAHANATTSAAGFESSADKTKLDAIEAGATADQSAAELLTAILTVDGTGSGLDADTVDGSHASAFILQTEKAAAGDVATIDAGTGKVYTAQLPASVAGGLHYEGIWNATSNSTGPLAGGYTPINGDYFKVSVAGTTSLSGITSWSVGDWAIYNGTSWDKIVQTDAISTVFGRTGAIAAQSGDYSATQITNTPAGNIAAATVQAAINELDTEKAAAVHSHAASDISFTPTGTLSSTTVQDAIAEAAAEGTGGGAVGGGDEGTIDHIGTVEIAGPSTQVATQATSFPANWQAGDYAILEGTINVVDATVNVPSGWTPHPSSATTGNVAAGGALQHFFFYRRLQVGDTAPTLANSLSAVKSYAATMSVYRGGSPTLPVGAFTHQGAGSAVQSLASPTMTPDRDNVRLIYAWATSAGTTANTVWTLPAGMTNRGDTESAASPKRPVVVGDEVVWGNSGVATGTRTASTTAAASAAMHVFAFALAPDTQATYPNPRPISLGRGGALTADAGMTGPPLGLPGTVREIVTRFHTPSSSGNVRYLIYRVGVTGTQTLVATIEVEAGQRVSHTVALAIPYTKYESFLLDPVDTAIGTGVQGWSLTMLAEES